jgi:hypothetical protein
MSLSDSAIGRAEKRMRTRLGRQARATSAHYDADRARIVISLSNGLELTVPVGLAQGLAGAQPSDLAQIEVTPAGLGLHWPRLDADLYLPALLEGVFGTRRWMAKVMGKAGGHSTSTAKAAAARKNGKLGGRPRRAVRA